MGSGAGGLFQAITSNQSKVAADKGFKNQGAYLGNAQNQALGYLDPYNQAGQTALSPLTGLLTGQQYDPTTGQSTTLTPDQRDQLMYQSPGYKFALQQGQQGLERNQAARHISLSGGAQKELASYLSGSALQNSNTYINQLAGLAGIGQNAANQQAGVVQNFGSQIGDTIANRGLTNANYYTQLGNVGSSAINQSLGNTQPQPQGQNSGLLGFGGMNSSGFSSVGSGANAGQFNTAATNSAGLANLSQFTTLAAGA